MKKIFVAIILTAGFSASAQIKIGDNPTVLNDGSLLELESNSKGVLFPRVALTSTSAWTLAGTQAMGMTVYNTTNTGDLTPGLYTYNGTVWVKNEAALKAPVLKIKYDTTSTTSLDYSTGEDIFIFTKTMSGLILPDAALYKNKVLYIRNEGTGLATYAAVSGSDGVKNPVGIVSIGSTAAQMVISDGTLWHMISGKI